MLQTVSGQNATRTKCYKDKMAQTVNVEIDLVRTNDMNTGTVAGIAWLDLPMNFTRYDTLLCS